uniref:ATP synthase subunit a n=1 Tax=Trisidos kiyonoi TaxID=935009 RepID=A0A1U9ALR1_TRIKY|nr:ATP synthase F0 subunit 6 [Trisidos kiyonoi]
MMSLFQMFDVWVGGGYPVVLGGLVIVVGFWLGFVVMFGIVEVYSSSVGHGLCFVKHIFNGLCVGGKFYAGFNHSLICLCLFILFMNFSGMVPGVINWSSHFLAPFFLGVSFWASSFMTRVKRMTKVLGSFVPEGCPLAISWLVMYVEILSTWFRPITLSSRLMGNVVLGKILIFLSALLATVSMWGFSSSVLGVFFVLFAVVIFSVVFLFELVVCFLQSYIFGMLVSSYTKGE